MRSPCWPTQASFKLTRMPSLSRKTRRHILPLILALAMSGCASLDLAAPSGADADTADLASGGVSPPLMEPTSPAQDTDDPTSVAGEVPPPREEQASVEAQEESAPFAQISLQGHHALFDSEDEIWTRVRRGYALPEHLDEPRVQSQIDWYRCHPDFLERVTARAEPYLHLIFKEIEARGMPSELLLLPVVESAYLPYAYSHGRAAGLWQFIPSTGRHFGLRQDWWYDGRRDVVASTRAALDYLQRLNQRFNGDWLLALAAYNGGQGTVGRAIERNARRGLPTDFWSLDLPRETQDYVPKLLAVAAIVRDPGLFDMALWPVPDEPYLTEVGLDSQIDLAIAADLAGLSVEEIYLLNPAFNRWATSPDGPHRLLLPIESAGRFQANLAALPAQARVTWRRHRIHEGESLGTIARSYGTTVAVLKQSNGLRGNTIRAGDHLLVPTAQPASADYRLTAEQRRQATQAQPKGAIKRTHVVRPGDTFWDIARRHGVSVRQLAAWNGMAPGDILRPGDEIVIWLTARAGEASLRLPDTDHPLSAETRRKVRYSVRSGDSLYRIAQRFSVDVADIQRWNNMNDGHLLRPGQALTLYVDVTRQGG